MTTDPADQTPAPKAPATPGKGSGTGPGATRLRLTDSARRRETPFEFVPDAEARAALARRLDVPGIRKLRLTGTLTPRGKADWDLDAELGATVIQDCVVTLTPVTTRIDEPVTRRFRADPGLPDGPGEVEMPEDDTIEPLPDTLDLSDVAAEALALALPEWPRAEGVEMGPANFAGPGIRPMTDEDARPFAGLAALKGALGGERTDDDED